MQSLLGNKSLVTIDFETFFDEKYTLKKLSTSEYVRDPLFEVLSCGIKVGDQPTEFVRGPQVRDALWAIDWRSSELLAHHAHFEGLVLSHHYGVRPLRYRDTLSMSRGLYSKALKHGLAEVAERLGLPTQKLEMPKFMRGKRCADFTEEEWQGIRTYNLPDVDACYEAYLRMLAMLPPEELELIDITVRMFADPVLMLDVGRTEKELDREVKAKALAVLESGATEEQLASTAKTAALLAGLGVEVPQKKSPRTFKLIPALAQTDVAFTSLANHPDERVAKLVKARLAVKSTIGETRARRLLAAAKGDGLPVYLNYCGAHTTRWSGGDKLNFQNFPRGGELRKCLLAPPGCVLVVVDSSQIEVRVLAWLARERWLFDAFDKKLDPYAIFASEAYGRPITKKDNPLERQVGKVCVLALGYSLGAKKLRDYLLAGTDGDPIDLPLEVCQELVDKYRNMSKAVVRLWQKAAWIVDEMGKDHDEVRSKDAVPAIAWEKGKLHLPNGMTLHYDDVISTSSRGRVREERPNPMLPGGTLRKHEEWGSRDVIFFDQSYRTIEGRTHIYGGMMVENIVQALARVIVAEQMRVMARRYRVAMMSHDEVVMAVPRQEADEALQFGLSTMRTRPAWAPDIPLDAEGGYDVRYSK